jgi:hypothetical protein
MQRLITSILFVALATGCSSSIAEPQITTTSLARSSVTASGVFIGVIWPKKSSSGVLEYSADANGNVAPVQEVRLAGFFGGPYGVDSSSNFWVGTTRYTKTGKVLGQVTLSRSGILYGPFAADKAGDLFSVEGAASLIHSSTKPGCQYTDTVRVAEYAAGAYGRTKPIRTIDLGNAPCTVSSIAVASSGALYVAENPPATGKHAFIKEFAPGATGSAKPARVINVVSTNSEPPNAANLQTDASGNLYVLINASQKAPPQLHQFGATGSTSVRELAGVPIEGFAAAPNGDITALVGTALKVSVQRFHSGASQPFATIAGSRTGLSAHGAVVDGVASSL